MTRLALLAATAPFAVALALLGSAAPATGSEQLMPQNLRVVDGTDVWHATDQFSLAWELSGPGTPRLVGVRYRIIAPDGTPSAVFEKPFTEHKLTDVRVRGGPGRYTAELWLEGIFSSGPHNTVPLLLDNARPAPPRVDGPPGWLGAAVSASLRIEAPAAIPASGISGYALSIDRGPEAFPCAKPYTCDDAEIDLRPAAGGTVDLGLLPEGLNYARVVTVSGSGLGSAIEAVPIRVDGRPPTVELVGVPADWANGPVRVVAVAEDRLSGMAAAGAAGPFTALRVDGAASSSTPGPSAATLITGDGSHRVESFARDAAGNLSDGPDELGSAVVRIDTASPRVSFIPSQDSADPERVEAVVADALSGPAGRGMIAVRRAGTRRSFEPLPTMASPGRLVARWDSEVYPAGSYEFRASGYDVAGNAAASNLRANGSRMVLANPLKRSAAISFGFGPKPATWKAAGRSVRPGHGVTVGGRLSAGSSRALAGMPVEIIESFARGAAIGSRTTTVTTSGDGSFIARLSPGPGRGIEARFAGSRVLGRVASRPLELRVPSAVGLRASGRTAIVGGAPILFSGRVGHRGARIPPSGLPVELQFRVPGSKWSEFRTVQTDRNGRFRYPYSFSDDDSRGVRFQFRAYLPPREDWPYEPGASRPVAITGR
jgi:hypothetical protein